MPKGALPPIGQLFGESWELLASRFWQYVWLILPMLILGLVPSFFMDAEGNIPGLENLSSPQILLGIVVFVVVFVYAMWVNAASILLLSERGKALSLGDLYRQSFPVLGAYILASILVSLGELVGFVLLILPGIYLAVVWAFTLFVVVDEQAGTIEAIKRSFRYVSGRWWSVFGRFLLLGLVLVAAYAGLVLITMLLTLSGDAVSPLANLFMSLLSLPLSLFGVSYAYRLYGHLKATQPAAPIARPTA